MTETQPYRDLAALIAEIPTGRLLEYFEQGTYPYAPEEDPFAAEFFTRFALVERYRAAPDFNLPAPLEEPKVFLYRYGKLTREVAARDAAPDAEQPTTVEDFTPEQTRLTRWRTILEEYLEMYDLQSTDDDGERLISDEDFDAVAALPFRSLLDAAESLVRPFLDDSADAEDLADTPGLLLITAFELTLVSDLRPAITRIFRDEITFRLDWRQGVLESERDALGIEE